MNARITIEPGKRSGQPCVRGLRITVWDVLGWLAGGMTEQEILADYPELEADDFRAVYDFAARANWSPDYSNCILVRLMGRVRFAELLP